MDDSLEEDVLEAKLQRFGYTIRRHHIDCFLAHHVPEIEEGGCVLDLGGKRVDQRGVFEIDRSRYEVVTLNIDKSGRPHVLGGGESLPFPPSTFDGVVCSEVLEHVRRPRLVLSEMKRVLRTNGIAFICVPFIYPYHPDPTDFGRYTEDFWRTEIRSAGFELCYLEPHGKFWAVASGMIRSLIRDWSPDHRLLRFLKSHLIRPGFARTRLLSLYLDERIPEGSHLEDYTTGYGIKAEA